MTIELTHEGRGWTARWPDAGVGIRVDDHDGTVGIHPANADVLVVTGTAACDGRLVVLDGVIDLEASSASRLVNGYQSWDYAGVRAASEPGVSWWGGAVARRPDGPGVAVLAATAERLATSIATEPAVGGIRVVVLAGGTPELTPVPGSWGFLPSEATGLDLAATGISESETVYLTAAPDAMAVMESLADLAAQAMRARRWDGPPILGWESWYHYGFEVTPEVVIANARLMRERFPDRFTCVQIDDGWQRSYGDWRPKDGWPADLGDLVSDIESLGCFAGLWLAPFMVAPGEPGIGEDRPDLLIAHSSGSPLRDPLMNRFGIDATHPDAGAWLHQLGSQVRAWGFRMVKLDFLYIGAQEAIRHDPSVTGTEALRQGLAAFIDGAGDPNGERVYVLGCGMPFLPATGLCHGNRIGGDLAAPRLWPFPELVPFDQDRGWLGVPPTARNIAARWWSHARLFHNDPDVVMACGPDEGPPYTVDEARSLHCLAAACGGPVFLADDLAALTPGKRAVLEDPAILDLAWHDGARPLDMFDSVDEAPVPEFYAQPTTLPEQWACARTVHFDWATRQASVLP